MIRKSDKYYKLMDEIIEICENITNCHYVEDDKLKDNYLSILNKNFRFSLNSSRWWSKGDAREFLIENDSVDWADFPFDLQDSINEKYTYIVISEGEFPSDWFWVHMRSSNVARFLEELENDHEFLMFPESVEWCIFDSNEGVICIYGDFSTDKLSGFERKFSPLL